MSIDDLPDPRLFPGARVDAGAAAPLYAAAAGAIEASTGREADRCDAQATRLLRASLAADGPALAQAFASAPSVAVARHLWRLLAALERADMDEASGLRAVLVALPVILVTALDSREAEITLAGALPNPRALEALLRDAHEFGGARTFALSPALAGADALDVAALAGLLARRTLADPGDGEVLPPLDFAPAPIALQGTVERVHLRFVAAAVLAPARFDPLQETSIAAWGARLAQALVRQLGVPGLSLLALPRRPQRLVSALQAGRAAQREVSAHLFASNAIRKFRAGVGEPTAVVSAHRAAGAPGGGELRLSLSSPFAPQEAEGFRCPLYPYEPVQEVAAMLVGLLRDCRVADVRVRPGIHPDVDPATGGPLLFKGGDSSAGPLH
jgi:hypothetical protein